MFEKDSDLIKFALNVWANHVESGDIAYSRNDIIEMMNTCKPGTPDHSKFAKMIKPLQDNQVEMVNRLRKLAEKQ